MISHTVVNVALRELGGSLLENYSAGQGLWEQKDTLHPAMGVYGGLPGGGPHELTLEG